MARDLHDALTDAVLRSLASPQSYARGVAYFLEGRVALKKTSTAAIRAAVHATEIYTVQISSAAEALDYSCDCPHAAEGAFCKHCVAAALAWLDSGKPSGKSTTRKSANAKEVTLEDAGKVLRADDKETLVRMLLDWAEEDDQLRKHLLQHAARRSGPKKALATAARAFERAVHTGGYVHYHEGFSWAKGVRGAIANFAQLLHDGHAAAVIDLCESALQQLVRAAEHMDDSDGHFTGLRDELESVHFQACKEARPEPAALARRLFAWEMQDTFDVFFGAAEKYKKSLGAPGLKEFQRLAQAEWAKVPTRTASNTRAEFGQHFRITHIMESLARASGDLGQLVAVMSRDLSLAYHYLQIAELYQEAKQYDEALSWAEKGLQAFPERTDRRLREFAANEYHRRQRHDDAMNLIWADFVEMPYLDTYRSLERHAKQAKNWPAWRERALAEIRAGIAKAAETSRANTRNRWSLEANDHSRLVEIFLYESDDDAAWREVQAGGCTTRLWLQLADKRRQHHPGEAGPIYLQNAEASVAETNNGRYEDAVALLAKAAATMKQAGRSAEFVHALESLRTKYKIKRNFTKLVEQKRRLLYLP